MSETGELTVATPAISRTDIETDAKLLTLQQDQPAINGYRCFIAITDRIFDEKGDFFLQLHKTDIVWGGQRALFVFEHHSGEFGLYYDIQAPDVISSESGGGPRRSATLFLKNKVFIPVPPEIQECFVPSENEKKRLEVKCDILYTKSQS